MTELTPGLTTLKDELMSGFYRDHHRRQARHKAERTAAISVAAFAALAGSALAAGSALGIIGLGSGVSAAQVTTLPVWDGTTGMFNSGTASGQYVYEFAGLGADATSCGPADPDVATFITSDAPLTQTDLEGLLDPENPIGLNDPGSKLTALGITGESSGCFPPSVAGPLGTPQTPGQLAAAHALTAKIIAQAKTGGADGAAAVEGLQNARPSRFQDVAITHDGERVVVRLRSKARARSANKTR